jgi:hypothetical protein
VNINGAQAKRSGKQKACAIMRLRIKESDASRRKPGRQAFSERAAPFIVGACLLSCRQSQVASVSKLQGCVAPSSLGALTSGSSGPAKASLRYAFAVH